MKVKFIDIFSDETKRGCKIQTNEYSLTGKYPIIDQGQEQIAGYTNLEDGIFCDVPVIVFGDHTRIVKYIETPFFLGADGVKVLKSKLCNTDYKYLFYWLSNANIPNTGYNRHFKWLKELEINLPSLDEQRHIAAVLDKVSDLIALRKKQLAKLDELVKARFVEMFGDPVLNTKKMDIVYLLDIAEYYNGLTYKPENIKDNGVIILRSSNIKNNHLNFDDIVRVDCNIKARLFVRENDILMCSRNGSSRLVGKVALVDNLFEPMGFGAFMMIVRSSYYSYLLIYFQLEAFRRQIRTGATTTINQITGAMLDKVMLPIPDQDSLESFNIFYKKKGFRLAREYTTAEGRKMNEYRYTLGDIQ